MPPPPGSRSSTTSSDVPIPNHNVHTVSAGRSLRWFAHCPARGCVLLRSARLRRIASYSRWRTRGRVEWDLNEIDAAAGRGGRDVQSQRVQFSVHSVYGPGCAIYRDGWQDTAAKVSRPSIGWVGGLIAKAGQLVGSAQAQDEWSLTLGSASRLNGSPW